jgi:hypothetical protein
LSAGRVSYHGSKSEKALGVWTDIADVLDYSFTSQQVRACVFAIAAALEAERLEERERCAVTFDEYYRQHVGIDDRRAQVGSDAAAAIRNRSTSA